MKALDELISTEERKIDYLTSIRHNPALVECHRGEECRLKPDSEIDYDIEKAYEQLAIYKIRKLMEF